jgi:amino acid transporter
VAKLPKKRGELGKEVGARQLFTLSFGTIIGVGWVIYLGYWLGPSGPIGAALGFLAATALIAIIGLCYAEMASMFPVSGGEIAYTYAAYGTILAFLTGWLLAIVYTAVTTWEAISIGLLAQNLVPGIQGPALYSVGGETVHLGNLLLGLVFMAFFTALNYRGVKWAATVQEYLMYTFFTVCIIFIGAGLLFGDIANLEPAFRRSAGGSIWPAVFATFATAPFFLAGFDTIPQIMEEKAPHTPVRLAALMIVFGVLAAGIFYALVIVSASMVVPWQNLLEMGDLPAASAFEEAFGSTAFSKLIILAALIGILTTWNAIFIAASRVIFALSRAWMIPPVFSSVHPKFGSPTSAILLVGAFGGLGVFLGRGGIAPITNMSATSFAIVFTLVCVGVLRLRRSRPADPRPYRVPGGITVIGVACLGALTFLFLASRSDCCSGQWAPGPERRFLNPSAEGSSSAQSRIRSYEDTHVTHNTIDTVAVVGTGVIGRSWAQLFARAQCNVRLYDRDAAQVSKALTWIEQDLENELQSGRITADELHARRGRIVQHGSLASALDGVCHRSARHNSRKQYFRIEHDEHRRGTSRSWAMHRRPPGQSTAHDPGSGDPRGQ